MCEYCGVQSEVSILYKYSTFNLQLFTNSNNVNGKISLMASVWTLMPGWYVEKTKSSVAHAEFYKHRVLSIEVSGLMLTISLVICKVQSIQFIE